MIINLQDFKILLKPGTTDFRKQINGLSVIAENELNQNVFAKILFVFCNKYRNRIKILYWDKNGFCLWMKRLEKDKFPWPKTKDNIYEIDCENLKMLLSGIDFFSQHRSLEYTKIS